jgi:hypothetical protein
MCGIADATSCERAVQRAWRDLCGLGTDEISAFHACTTLYLIRHPAGSLHEARDLVAERLDHDARESQGESQGD